MRVLLDECVDRRFAKDIIGHDVKTVAEMEWVSKRNGELLVLAEQAFDVFITVDRNLSFQRNLLRLELRSSFFAPSATAWRICALSPQSSSNRCRKQSAVRFFGSASNFSFQRAPQAAPAELKR